MSIIWRDVSTSHPLLLKQQGNFEHVISSPLDNTKESLLICASEHGYIFVYKMLPHLFSVVNGGNAGGVGYPYEEPHPLKHDDTVVYSSENYPADAIDIRKLPLCHGDVIPWAVLGVSQDNTPALPLLAGMGKITSLRIADELITTSRDTSATTILAITAEGSVFAFTLPTAAQTPSTAVERVSAAAQAIPASPIAPKVRNASPFLHTRLFSLHISIP